MRESAKATSSGTVDDRCLQGALAIAQKNRYVASKRVGRNNIVLSVAVYVRDRQALGDASGVVIRGSGSSKTAAAVVYVN
jgi:hypothetical protein